MTPHKTCRVKRSQLDPEQHFSDPRQASEPLRADFQRRCAYCMIHEHNAGGPAAFQVDHHCPQVAGGRNNYGNLHWACMPCNMFKHGNWPSARLLAEGYRFADPCLEWDYGVHFCEQSDGSLRVLDAVGRYHVAVIWLDRPILKELRRERTAAVEDLQRIASLAESMAPEQALRSRLDQAVQVLTLRMATEIPFIVSALDVLPESPEPGRDAPG